MKNSKRNTEIAQRLGRYLAEQRKASGYTQEQVAERLGVEQETISRFERGSTLPPLRRLFDLADLLEAPIESMLRTSSVRPSDQMTEIADMMATLEAGDREWVRGWVLSMCQLLAARPPCNTPVLCDDTDDRMPARKLSKGLVP